MLSLDDGGNNNFWQTIALALFGGGGFFTLLAKGVRGHMLWRRSRFSELEAKVEKLQGLVPLVTCLGDCCMILVSEVRDISPKSKALGHVESMLKSDWPEMLNKVFQVPSSDRTLEELAAFAETALGSLRGNDA